MLEPERKVAQLLLKKKKLVPPIDVEGLIKEKADIEIANFPGTCDCLLLRKKGAKPKLIMPERTKKNSNRYRFTLAHELGHMTMPWQGGTVFCHTDLFIHTGDDISQAIEGEANRFASELLLPTWWLDEKIQSGGLSSANDIVGTAKYAGVSPITAMISVGRLSAPGRIFFIRNQFQEVTHVATSPKSICKAPMQGQKIEDMSQFQWAGGLITQAVFGPNELVVVEFQSNTILLDSPPVVSSTEIIKSIIEEIEPDPLLRRKISNMVNGVVGVVNGYAVNGRNPSLTDKADLLGRFRQKFINRPALSPILEHSRFNEFLEAKAYELWTRHKK